MGIIERCQKSEEGVSPVIGVMLMLVVTIIVAALVSSFAGGLGSTMEKTPVAALDISIDMNPNMDLQYGPLMLFRHIGGDPLDTKDLQIIFEYTIPAYQDKKKLEHGGKVIKRTIDGSIEPGTVLWDPDESPFVHQVTNEGMNPTINAMNFLNWANFGTFVLTPGREMQSVGQTTGTGLAGYDGFENLIGFDYKNSKYGFGDGSKIHVTIVHIPTGKTVYDKDVYAK